MRSIIKWSAMVGVGAALLTTAGCADRNKNGQPESPASGSEVENAVDSAGGKARDAGREISDATERTFDRVVQAAPGAARKAGDAVSKAATKAGAALTDAGEATAITTKVKSALLATPQLDSSRINVDTLVAKKSVALRGLVKTAAEKTLALRVAKTKAPNYKIIDQLKIAR
ncbi:BON domain-containing protein [bacterium]|nr:MAG: BON domain-containing protein [bacterium]